MIEAADTVVVGGGLVGTAAAFFLSRRGRKVILLERDLVGSKASGTNFGNVRRQGRYLQQLPLANRAREIWTRMPELIDDDIEFLASGHLRVCYTEAQAAKVEAYAREANQYGLDLEILSGNAVRDRFPFLGTGVICGSYAPHDGHANPRLAAPAFARAARRIGAVIQEHTEVVSVEKIGDDFHVLARDGRIVRAPSLLVSNGAWGGRLSEQFGEPVPIAAHAPQMAVTEPVPYMIRPTIGVSTPHVAETVYFRQIPRGNIILGGGTRGPAFPDLARAHVLPQNTMNQFPQFMRVMPGMASLNIIRTWAGIEGYLPDDFPIMGPSPRVPGLFYAFGFCGAGFQIAPGVGDVMAELIDTGHTTTPIEPFGIGRFASSKASIPVIA